MPTKKSATTKKAAKKAVKKPTPKKVAKKPAKKVTKKATKKSAKKSSPKAGAKDLVQTAEAQAFWVTDGSILRNLLELRDALKSMEAATYAHHVNKERNDFADWVEHVLQDPDCAASLRKSKKPNSARTVVVRHLKIYRL